MAPSTSSNSTSPSFLQQKRIHFFRHFLDTNGDGLVGKSDLDLLISRVEKLARKSEFIRIKLSLVGLWHDVDDLNCEDEFISESDWLSFWEKKKASRTESSMMAHVFQLLDASADQLIDESEFIHVFTFFGRSREEAMRCFDYVGRTDTGDPVFAIDAKRFGCLWKEFFYSDDPSSYGNFLFGLIPSLQPSSP